MLIIVHNVIYDLTFHILGCPVRGVQNYCWICDSFRYVKRHLAWKRDL